jgi:hypothetical protein
VSKVRQREWSLKFLWLLAVIKAPIQDGAKVVATVMYTLMAEDGSVFRSIENLAADIGESKTTAKRKLQSLVDSGWLLLVKRGGGGRASEYIAVWPENSGHHLAPVGPDQSEGTGATSGGIGASSCQNSGQMVASQVQRDISPGVLDTRPSPLDKRVGFKNNTEEGISIKEAARHLLAAPIKGEAE